MADLTIITRHPSIKIATGNVSEAHTVYNKGGEPLTFGAVVRVTRGSRIIEHIDAEGPTLTLNSGESGTIDVTGVSGAVAVGYFERQDQVTNTGDLLITEVGIITAKEDGPWCRSVQTGAGCTKDGDSGKAGTKGGKGRGKK